MNPRVHTICCIEYFPKINNINVNQNGNSNSNGQANGHINGNNNGHANGELNDNNGRTGSINGMSDSWRMSGNRGSKKYIDYQN